MKKEQVIKTRRKTRRHRSFTNHRRSAKIIHVTVRSSTTKRSLATSNSHGSLTRSSDSTKSSKMTSVNTMIQNGPMYNFYKPKQTSDTFATIMNYTNKQNNKNLKRKATRKYKRICLSLSCISILIIATVITVVLLILLQQSKPRIKLDYTPVLRWNRTGITVAGQTGVAGTNSSLFKYTWGLAVDYEYSLYVADRSNHRVQKFLKGSLVGITVAGLMNESAVNNPSIPKDLPFLVLDSDQNLYIAEVAYNRIQFWEKNANVGITVAGTGVPGNGLNQLYSPYGLSRDENTGSLFIADTTNNRIMMYRAGNFNGTILAGFNGPGFSNTQIREPMAVYYDSVSNSLLITNCYYNQIVRWVLSENHWTLVAGAANGQSGSNSAMLGYPMGLTLDPMGNLYVADRWNQRAQFFSAGQSNGITIAGNTGIPGSDSTSFRNPFAVTLDNQLNLYVADTDNHRVQKFLRY